MARIRSIHPEACTSATLAKLSANAERTFWRLLTHCDDYGKCQDRPRVIWATLYPEHEDMGPAEVERDLTELHEFGLIVRYEVAGLRYIAVSSWSEFQHPQRPRQSKYPDPPQGSATPPRAVPETSAKPPANARTGVEWSGEGVEPEREKEKRLAESPSAPGDPLFDAICSVSGIDPTKATKDERGRVNAACKQLREAGATTEEVDQRARAWRRKFPEAHLTPQSLTKSWSSLAGTARTSAPPRCGECGQPLGESHTAEACRQTLKIMGRAS